MKNKKTDDSVIQFMATMRDDGKCYDVNVFCEQGLSLEDFADTLLSLAKDIYMGQFSFNHSDAVVSSQ